MPNEIRKGARNLLEEMSATRKKQEKAERLHTLIYV